MKTIIYHNNRCSKSRETLELVNNQGDEVEIIDYLNQAPTEEKLREILRLLNHLPAVELVRKNEELFKENFKGKTFSNDEWISILAQNPKLIERPIVIRGNKAVIGRPPSTVLSLF
jgi:arsenate reductase